MSAKYSAYSIVVSEEQVTADLVGEVIILNLKSGVYYGLNAAGARIWHLLQERKTVEHVLDALLGEFDVEPECCERDLVALLRELATAGLIELNDGPVA